MTSDLCKSCQHFQLLETQLSLVSLLWYVEVLWQSTLFSIDFFVNETDNFSTGSLDDINCLATSVVPNPLVTNRHWSVGHLVLGYTEIINNLLLLYLFWNLKEKWPDSQFHLSMTEALNRSLAIWPPISKLLLLDFMTIRSRQTRSEFARRTSRHILKCIEVQQIVHTNSKCSWSKKKEANPRSLTITGMFIEKWKNQCAIMCCTMFPALRQRAACWQSNSPKFHWILLKEDLWCYCFLFWFFLRARVSIFLNKVNGPIMLTLSISALMLKRPGHRWPLTWDV